MKRSKKIPVECYTRVVGYFRPVMQWNDGKQEEFRQRKTIDGNHIKIHGKYIKLVS